jgi:transposase-like protein
MLTELRNRGLADALIVCCDGLKGLPESIRLTWPQATVQTCVVHMVRNSLRYASRKHWKQITTSRWEATCPAMIQAWRSVWPEFVPFLEFPVELRKIVYTTNAIESLNARFRRAVRHRAHFPTEQSAMKVLYLVATQQRKNRQDLTGKINGWKTILNTLTVHYGDRIAANDIN